ncbi:unnamed protein product [Adineta steineri]|uniref:Uncharacterized protein n=1 Tax=Adineta steineri TaxID=433720 RepID=A0A819E4B8_9BILA|nr:unnamed protein product [Adineta steineri]CAF3844477.1 unnamed protein product [Adineta steineri]
MTTTKTTITTTTKTTVTTTTTTTITTTIANYTGCNITGCRLKIAAHISQNQTYDTKDFTECINCGEAQYPNFPGYWSTFWHKEDFVVLTSAGYDCTGNPYNGDLIQCERFCLTDPTCVGFSRGRNVLDTTSGDCYLKNNIQFNRTYNYLTWQTVILNMTS